MASAMAVASVVAAYLEAVGAPTPIGFIDRNATVMARLDKR
jgi:hypothetical protein